VTLRWVMRDPRPDEPLDGPAMAPDTVVKQAARDALGSDRPIRVMEGEKLLGVVDHDDLLRVIVAEEGA
jgi:glycine betaine/proline transport system ATP-binding protein